MSFNTPGQQPPYQSIVLQIHGMFARERTCPVLSQIVYNDDYYLMSGGFLLTANASAVTRTLPLFNDLKFIFFWDDEGSGANNLSLKYNSETTTYAVKPYTGRGGLNVTQVVATNANTTTAKRLNWIAIDSYALPEYVVV